MTDEKATLSTGEGDWALVAELNSADLRAFVHSLLSAHGIPHRFGNQHFDAIHPGPDIPGYNRSLLTVRRRDVGAARELLEDLKQGAATADAGTVVEWFDLEGGSWWAEDVENGFTVPSDTANGADVRARPEGLRRALDVAFIALGVVAVLSLLVVVLSRLLG